jgi:hypothetical protein
MTRAPSPDAAAIQQLIRDTLPWAEADNPAIFGGGSPMDSLGLVNFLADLEYRVSERYGRPVVLASERAMSLSRSPFRDANALTEFILELLSE